MSSDYTGESYSYSPCLRLELSLGICLIASQKERGVGKGLLDGGRNIHIAREAGSSILEMCFCCVCMEAGNSIARA